MLDCVPGSISRVQLTGWLADARTRKKGIHKNTSTVAGNPTDTFPGPTPPSTACSVTPSTHRPTAPPAPSASAPPSKALRRSARTATAATRAPSAAPGGTDGRGGVHRTCAAHAMNVPLFTCYLRTHTYVHLYAHAMTVPLYMYTHTYMSTCHVCTFMYTYTHLGTHICTCHDCTFIYVHAHIYVHMPCMYLYVYVHTLRYTYIHMPCMYTPLPLYALRVCTEACMPFFGIKPGGWLASRWGTLKLPPSLLR